MWLSISESASQGTNQPHLPTTCHRTTNKLLENQQTVTTYHWVNKCVTLPFIYSQVITHIYFQRCTLIFKVQTTAKLKLVLSNSWTYRDLDPELPLGTTGQLRLAKICGFLRISGGFNLSFWQQKISKWNFLLTKRLRNPKKARIKIRQKIKTLLKSLQMLANKCWNDLCVELTLVVVLPPKFWVNTGNHRVLPFSLLLAYSLLFSFPKAKS